MKPDVCVSAHHTNWLFEAQNSELLQSLFYNHTVSFTFTRGMFPLEYYSVGYCIAHSHSKWLLTFDGETEKEELHMLLNGAKTGNGDYRVAALKATSMTPENLYILVNGFSSCVKELYCSQIPDNGNSLSLPLLSSLHIQNAIITNKLQIQNAFNMSCDLSFPSLEALIIRKGTTLGAKTCKAIGKLLSSATPLKQFHLSSCEYVSEKDMEVITKSLGDNTTLPLKSLVIDCKCIFTTTATRSLAEFIETSTTLQCLKIHINPSKDVDIFAEGLSNNTALPLKSLDIDCKCTFTTTATRSLIQFVTRSTTLEYIRICHVTFSAQGLVELTESIHRCSKLQEKLKQLSFRVECSEDVVNLKHMIKDHPDMQRSIDWNKVTKIHESAQEVNEINALTLSLTLKYADVTLLLLVGKKISDTGATFLSQALHHNSTLKGLYLNSNSICDAGAVDLALALQHNSSLECLVLSNNNISDVGAIALAKALHHNSTLKELNLSGNNAIGKDGTQQLVQALTVNKSITKASTFGGLRLPRRCEEYATQCKQYTTVKNRIDFF